jgi:hypothetical protein
MGVRLRVSNAFIHQPRVQLVEGFEPQAGREESVLVFLHGLDVYDLMWRPTVKCSIPGTGLGLIIATPPAVTFGCRTRRGVDRFQASLLPGSLIQSPRGRLRRNKRSEAQFSRSIPRRLFLRRRLAGPGGDRSWCSFKRLFMKFADQAHRPAQMAIGAIERGLRLIGLIALQ